MSTLTATEFKAKCLALIDRVRDTREPITITKRGKPVARVFPVAGEASARGYPQHALRGTVKVLGDIISPPDPPEVWEVERIARRRARGRARR